MNQASKAAVQDTEKPMEKMQAKAGLWAGRMHAFFRDDPVDYNVPQSSKEERARYKSLVRTVQKRSFIIVGLIIANLLLAPILRPSYHYYAVSDDRKFSRLMVPLLEPNQTDQAVLSWAATSITEVMTFGFGDIDQRLLAQKHRFTSDGWDSFIEALKKNDLREGFKMRQLVLTTVPTDAPVIVSKGQPKNKDGTPEEGGYQWIVEMPIILTYVTNNNVSSGTKGIIRLTIVRVPNKQNPSGIGIKIWQII